MFQKSSLSAVNNNNNATNLGQTVDFAAAKLNGLYGGDNIPRLDGPEKFRRSSKGHMHGNTSAAQPSSTTASPITECTATTTTSSSSMAVVSLVPLREAAVAAVCAMAVAVIRLYLRDLV